MASCRVVYADKSIGAPLFTAMIVDDLNDLDYLIKNIKRVIPTYLSDIKTEG